MLDFFLHLKRVCFLLPCLVQSTLPHCGGLCQLGTKCTLTTSLWPALSWVSTPANTQAAPLRSELCGPEKVKAVGPMCVSGLEAESLVEMRVSKPESRWTCPPPQCQYQQEMQTSAHSQPLYGWTLGFSMVPSPGSTITK